MRTKATNSSVSAYDYMVDTVFSFLLNMRWSINYVIINSTSEEKTYIIGRSSTCYYTWYTPPVKTTQEEKIREMKLRSYFLSYMFHQQMAMIWYVFYVSWRTFTLFVS